MLCGIIAAHLLAARVTCQASVYAQGIYSAGMTYFSVCATTLAFPPYRYDMTEMSWNENTNGQYIFNPIRRTREPGDVTRRRLKVQCGSDRFYFPLDSGPARQWESKDDPLIVKGFGNLAPVLMQSATNRGGRTTTHALAVVQAKWIRGSRPNGDIFVLDGDHFEEVQKLLEQAYGKPDAGIHSSSSSGGDCRSIYYTPAQTGVFLNLASTWDDTTIVSIIGQQNP